MNGAIGVAYAMWILRWVLASNTHWLQRLFASVLLLPGLMLATYCALVAASRLSALGGHAYVSNADYRAEVFLTSAVSIAGALLFTVLDRRRTDEP